MCLVVKVCFSRPVLYYVPQRDWEKTTLPIFFPLSLSTIFLRICWLIPEKPETHLVQRFRKTTLAAKSLYGRVDILILFAGHFELGPSSPPLHPLVSPQYPLLAIPLTQTQL